VKREDIVMATRWSFGKNHSYDKRS
jgi:hypothetical protein